MSEHENSHRTQQCRSMRTLTRHSSVGALELSQDTAVSEHENSHRTHLQLKYTCRITATPFYDIAFLIWHVRYLLFFNSPHVQVYMITYSNHQGCVSVGVCIACDIMKFISGICASTASIPVIVSKFTDCSSCSRIKIISK